MIEARFFAKDGTLNMVLHGHAGAAPKGKDLVCAGVSTLAWALGDAVTRMAPLLDGAAKVQLEEGYAEVTAKPKGELCTEVTMAFWTIQNGIAALAESFPKNVKLAEALVLPPSGGK